MTGGSAELRFAWASIYLIEAAGVVPLRLPFVGIGDKLLDMSKQTADLLEAFEALAPDEKRIFTAEFLRRAVPFDSGPLDDEETAHAADSLFSLLDAEEITTSCFGPLGEYLQSDAPARRGPTGPMFPDQSR